MFRPEFKKFARKFLTLSFLLVGLAALLASPAERRAYAFEPCDYCMSNYQSCMEACRDSSNCELGCYFNYQACVGSCGP
jgi:hypothetical protein